MRILILTVAGMSTRFSESLGKPCIKCVYYESDFSQSLLYRALHQNVDFDKYIIVGGYMFDDLKNIINEHFYVEFGDKIVLVNNEKYAEYGSGYSLYMGLNSAVESDFDEIVFAEGDLYFDRKTFENVCYSKKSVITCNSEPISADRSVAFFFDTDEQIHYIYDTAHNSLEIKVPFLSIHNSGQIWKFADQNKLIEVYKSIATDDWKKTNLVFVEKYFQSIGREDHELIRFREWINCNTVSDFRNIPDNCIQEGK